MAPPSPGAYRFVTFNVCGIKSLLSRCAQWVPERSYSAMFEHLGADVVCFQETKVQPDGIDKDMALVSGFSSFFACSTKPKGYSGVAFYVKNTIRVLKAEEGLTGWLTSTPGGQPYRERATSLGADVYPDISQHEGLQVDAQGRCITLDLGACVVVGLYCPADSSGNMTEYRDLFFQLLDWRVTRLRALGREVVVLGDLNVAREPIDSATIRESLHRAKEPVDEDVWKHGCVSHKAVNDWIEVAGFHDTTREAHPDRGNMFTCWDQSKNARPANFGSRIDYVLASSNIECTEADIMPDLMGSDHCPVYADLCLSGIEPQGQHRLPMLSRRYTSKWEGGVKAFFSAGAPRSKPVARQPTASEPTASDPTAGEPSRKKVKTEGESKPAPPNTNLVASLSQPSKSRPSPPSDSPPLAKRIASSPTGVSATHQASLSKLFATKSTDWVRVSEKKPPLCSHNEPCTLKMSKKAPRKGEYFWHCARPHGGKMNVGGKYQCKTFIWESEVKR